MEETGEVVEFPATSGVSSSLHCFLNDKFRCREDLSNARSLASELEKQCSDLDLHLSEIHQKFSAAITRYGSYEEQIGKGFEGINEKLSLLNSDSPSLRSQFKGNEEVGRQNYGVLAEELPKLAREVTRVETVRAYAETALKLDALIGDVEDAVSSLMERNVRKPSLLMAAKPEENRLSAIKSLKLIEETLSSIIRSRPHWSCLVSAVDSRVDQALAVLRPQAIADHRALLASLSWPPPLSSANLMTQDTDKLTKFSNPLFLMQGDLKSQYCENFLALCSLQELQMQRKSRRLRGHDRDIATTHQPLWTIEELASPLALSSESHYSKWMDKPEFIFALNYKVTRDFVDAMDEVLQPLVDRARLRGYSCREEWVSAMTTSLVTYLEKEIYPAYISRLEDCVEDQTQARGSWLHLLDLMIDFDKRMHDLVAASGISMIIASNESFKRVSIMSLFCDRPDWLEIWAEIELKDALDKLSPKFENEKSWTMIIQGEVSILGPESCSPPVITNVVLQCLSPLFDRCRPLPDIQLRMRFIELSCLPIMRNFITCLQQRCQEAEALTALTDDDAVIKVSNSVNAAMYCQSTLEGWSEDVFFLEMRRDEDYESIEASKGVFGEAIVNLQGFRNEWAGKLSTVTLRGFDARCRDYIKNRKQWQELGDVSMSSAFIDTLDFLQVKTTKLGLHLNEVDFAIAWRGLAGGVDQLIFNGVLMGSVKFSNSGVERFAEDMSILFKIFGSWCLSPQGFFPRLNEGVKVLKMEERIGREFSGSEGNKARWLKEHRIRHLSLMQVEKLLKSRNF